jgi:lipoprotein NlpD
MRERGSSLRSPGFRTGFVTLLCALVVACGTSTKKPARPRPPSASQPAKKPAPVKKQSDSASAGKSVTPRAAPSPGAAAGTFLWPASGQLAGRFNGGANKGIDIRGQAGDPVIAAAAGRVVYAGSELRGYGNLVMIKHNDEFMTAYAHNRKLLVRENEQVKAGQKIAEMGSTGANATQLHFELRRNGDAVDPLPYLKEPSAR